MEKRRRSPCRLLLAAALALIATLMPSPGEAATAYEGGGATGLSPNYYGSRCPKLEEIVLREVTQKKNETVVTIPAVLRLFFHDCLVNGCDGSVLISSSNYDAEKDAPDQMSLAGDGFDTVNRVKDAVEKSCPGVVSCADILALATRDVVRLAFGPSWTVELGRRDGLVSKPTDVDGKLPGENMHVKELAAIFDRNGMSVRDMVALSGAHTVGFAHCTRFTNRLYNYNSTMPTDPSFYPLYAEQLKKACPRDVNETMAVNMDPKTPVKFDNNYYTNLGYGLGLFTSDAVLYSDKATRKTVDEFAESQDKFFEAFVDSMIKLGRVGVKTGNDGEIRRVCSAFNH